MHVQLHFQDFRHTPWMDQFFEKRLARLDRFLTPASEVHLNVKYENKSYQSHLLVRSRVKDYAFSAEGLNLFESFSEVVDKAVRVLSEQQRKMRTRFKKDADLI